MRNIIRKLAVCFLAWILVCTTVVTGHGMHTAKAAQTFKIHFIDVGCADAALLQYGEGTEAKYALIDTGANQYHNTKDTTIDTTKTPVYEYLNKMGVKHLEFILLTHPHQDHIGGMEKILSDTTIKIDKIYGNDLNIQYLKSSEDKSKQSSDETNWTEFDTKIYKNFKASRIVCRVLGLIPSNLHTSSLSSHSLSPRSSCSLQRRSTFLAKFSNSESILSKVALSMTTTSIFL